MGTNLGDSGGYLLCMLLSISICFVKGSCSLVSDVKIDSFDVL